LIELASNPHLKTLSHRTCGVAHTPIYRLLSFGTIIAEVCDFQCLIIITREHILFHCHSYVPLY